MNCANHPQNPVAAYCRTCGKPLCNNCTRQVMGVIYCENCLAERVSGTSPAQGQTQYQGIVQPPPGGGPNPALAGILAGFFPFGVGAVYCGQYAKGLAHLIVFVLLIIGASHTNSDTMGTVFGLSIAAFYFYQLIDSIKTAKALQANQPVPDPFGLATMFSPGEKPDFSKGVPTGAVVLIGLGVLFLLHNLGIWFLEVDTLWPVFLIGLGAWLFARRQASRARGDYRHRSVAGPAILVTVGVLALLSNLHDRWYGVPGWDRTWPVILLVLGIVKLMERTGTIGGPPPQFPEPPSQAGPPPAQQPPTEVNTEVKNG
jgi:TM2 domain-containing membrane protein YozV